MLSGARRVAMTLLMMMLTMTAQTAWAETIDLSQVSSETTVNDGDVLTGTLEQNVQISVDVNATITLNNVQINQNCQWTSGNYAGITCLGNATIILAEGSENTVKGFYPYYPGIYVPSGSTLTIEGSGSLTVCSSNPSRYDAGPGIGAGYSSCGDIVIKGGTITATGAKQSAGIGGGYHYGKNCGNITIKGGTINATGGDSAAGIGAGYGNRCGSIVIEGGTITATGYTGIGKGQDSGTQALSSCGNITLGWTDADNDCITASNYRVSSGSTVSIAEGQVLTDGTNNYIGQLSTSQISTIAGKTLTPTAPITMTVTAENVNTTYDGLEHYITVNVSGPASGATITYCETEDGTYTSTNPTYTDAGEYVVYYKVTASGYNDNSGSATVTIDPKEIIVRAESKYDKVYGDPDPVFTYDLKDGDDDYTLIDGNTMTGALGREAGENVGNYNIYLGTLSAGNNYSLTLNDNGPILCIEPKPLTVTANDHTISYGDAPANHGVTYEGFVEGENQDTEGIFGTTTLTYNYKTAADGTGEDYTTSSPAGTYYIIPSGLTATNYDITFVSGTLTVEPVPVKFSVVDIANGEELEGAIVQVIEKKDENEEEVVEEWTSTTESHEIEGLKTGVEYILRETVAPEGYIISGDFTFTIAEDGTITTTGTITEDGVLLVENSKTQVKISVVDIADGAELADATVQVLDSEENVVEEWDSTTESHVHVITGLNTGVEYTLHETVAPEGYIIPAATKFTIAEDGSITSSGCTTTDDDGLVLLVENSMTKVKISVVDIADGEEELEGATVQVLDSEGNVVEEWTSTTEPHVIEGLNTGVEYTLHETVAPSGYAIPTDFTFTIAEDGSITSSGSTTTDEEGLTVLLVENERTGDLTVSCVVISDLAADADAEFTFTVTLGDTSISGTFGGMTFTDGEATITLKGGESATATGLPTTLTYTVTEADAEGFQLTGKTNDTGTIEATGTTATFTNTRETGDLQLSNTVYADNNDVEFTFTVTLLDETINGNYVDMTFTDGVATVTLKGGESATATGLPTSLNYTVSQTDKEGYHLDEKTGDTGTISTTTSEATFTYIQLVEVKVTKVWDDSDNQDGKRPDDVTVNLLADGRIIDTVTLSEENSWTYTWTNLDKYNGEGAIDYTVTEEAVAKYTTSITKANDGTFTYTVTNSHETEETEATVELHWDDADNQDGKRPESVKALLSNGTEVTLNEENSWTATVEHLPKYANGEEIVYTWTEDEEGLPEGYGLTDSSVNGTVTTLTNSYVPVTNGYCGTTGNEESVTWSYDASTKTLSISGTGYMMYYNSVQNADNSYSNGAPWKAFANEIESVTIGNGITYVGSNTFAHCPSISSVTLPTSGIYEIGPGAFADCTSLESIDIPMSINTIGNQAFAGCSSLATVSIGYGDPGTFTLGSEVFPVTTTILVPESAYENYIKEKAVKESVEIDNPFYGYKDKIVPATRTFFANGTNTWMTWCDVNAWTLPEGCTAYTVSSVSGTTVTLSNALTTIPAYTPVLIQRDENATTPVTAAFSAVGTAPASGYDSTTGIASTTDTGWAFYGTTTDLATIPEADYSAGLTYVLYGDKFLKSDNNSGIAANRCWLKLEAGGGTSGARLLSIVIDDNPTAIDNVQWSMVNGQSDSWYTIDGRKLNGKPTKKGLYIYNGKKVAIK